VIHRILDRSQETSVPIFVAALDPGVKQETVTKIIKFGENQRN